MALVLKGRRLGTQRLPEVAVETAALTANRCELGLSARARDHFASNEYRRAGYCERSERVPFSCSGRCGSVSPLDQVRSHSGNDAGPVYRSLVSARKDS